MDEFIDSHGNMMVCSDPIWMSTAEYTEFNTLEGVGRGVLEPLEEEVGVVGWLKVSQIT